MAKANWIVIGQGKAGWHASGTYDGNKASSHGGTLEEYCREAVDGTWIYDASQVDLNAFTDWVFRGPLLGQTLKPGEVKRFMEQPTLARMLPGLDGAFKEIGVISLLIHNKLGPMDSVALDVWCELFNEIVPGVKWGKVLNGMPVWE